MKELLLYTTYSKLLSIPILLAGWSVFCSIASAKDSSGNVSLGLSIPNYNFDLTRNLTDSDAAELTLSYAPNLPLTSFVGVSMFGLTLKASADVAGTNENDPNGNLDKKVKTDFSSYSADYFFSRFGVDGSYTYLKGMNLVEITGVSEIDLKAMENIHRSDIELKHQSVNLWAAPISFNLSLEDFFDFASKPRGSAFGVVLLGSYDAVEQQAEFGLVPLQFRSKFGADQTYKSGAFKSTALQCGPAFVLDYRGFFLEGLITVGQGQQSASYKLENDEELLSSRGSDKSNFYYAMGYKGGIMFTGFDFTSESPGFYLNSMSIVTERFTGRWLIGARF